MYLYLLNRHCTLMKSLKLRTSANSVCKILSLILGHNLHGWTLMIFFFRLQTRLTLIPHREYGAPRVEFLIQLPRNHQVALHRLIPRRLAPPQSRTAHPYMVQQFTPHQHTVRTRPLNTPQLTILQLIPSYLIPCHLTQLQLTPYRPKMYLVTILQIKPYRVPYHWTKWSQVNHHQVMHQRYLLLCMRQTQLVQWNYPQVLSQCLCMEDFQM